MKFRELNAQDIEVRVNRASEYGVTLLLYKNARTDMQILDDAVGAENWQREHYECKGNLFCHVGIKCGDTWVWKADCGTESNTEAQKGEASDSFKRACTNWGIGRSLYTAPEIKVAASRCNLKDKNGKKACYDAFVVEAIEFSDGKITALAIRNTDMKDKNGEPIRCFAWRKS